MVDDAPTHRERPAGAAADDDVPWMVDRFMIERELGAGGMGRVYLGYDPNLDRHVAIKLLREEPLVDVEKAHARMAREARAMARLHHPNVVAVHEVGKHEGRVFIVMEYVDGGTLRDRVDTGGDTLGWEPIVALYVAAGRGLEAAHAAGLVHRDFKPDNVLVEKATARVLVTDFGIANVYGDDPVHTTGDRQVPAGLTQTGTLIGTPPYMSPEQHRAGSVDARTDQFSYCAALYEALFGVRPFAGTDIAAISENTLHGIVTPPRIDRGVPKRITAAVLRGLRPEIADRFPTMTALLAELSVERPKRRWLAPAAAAAIVTAAVVVIAWSRDREPAKHAPSCDCETFTVTTAGRILGATPITPLPSLRIPITGLELAIPRGRYTIDYEVDGVTYAYGVVSKGAGAGRTIALPVPEVRDGYAFIPGGEVPIGDLRRDGDADERPITTIQLAPYLIATREEAQLYSYDEAVTAARDAHARLPTAAEWEWAARGGRLERALANQWEWTASRYKAYPYDETNDDLTDNDPTAEVRGGQIGSCKPGADLRATACADDPPRISRRLAGHRSGVAELRLVRTPLASLVRELRVELDGGELRPGARGKMARFMAQWLAVDRVGSLQVTTPRGLGSCSINDALKALDLHRIEIVHDDTQPADEVVIRAHPNPQFLDPEGRIGCTDTSIEILDEVCFEAERLTPGSLRTIDAAAASLIANTAIGKLEVQGYVARGTPDPLRASQHRAEMIRQRMIAAGVAPTRVVATGYGLDGQTITAEDAQRRALISSSACRAGGRIAFLILERNTGD